MIYDLIIVGGGPAGMTAAVYAARKKIKALIITESFGGQAVWSTGVENYLGFEFISGVELVEKFKDHLERFDLDKEMTLANGIYKSGDVFTVATKNGQEFSGRAVVIATGRAPRFLSVPGEKEFYGRGVTYCATCDGPLFNGMDVVIVGGSEAAFEAVMQMSAIAGHVYMVAHDEFSVLDVVVAKARQLKNLTIFQPAKVAQIIGQDLVSQVMIKDLDSGDEKTIDVRGVIIEIGSIPVSTFIGDLVEFNDDGEIIVDCFTRTKTPGIFAAGDVTHGPHKQIIIAAGEGAKAALSAYSYLIEH